MTVTMDSAGRLIEIAPKAMDVTFEREGPFLVAQPKHPVPTLTHAAVNRTIAKIRRERTAAWHDYSKSGN